MTISSTRAPEQRYEVTSLAHPIPGRWLHSENVEFEGSHMLERCRLFLIIALGETVLTTGAAIATAPMTLMTGLTGTVALATMFAEPRCPAAHW